MWGFISEDFPSVLFIAWIPTKPAILCEPQDTKHEAGVWVVEVEDETVSVSAVLKHPRSKGNIWFFHRFLEWRKLMNI